ncbi:MAG: molybdopterin molybdotransferase MoeA [Thermoproteota archaeon]
MIRYVEKPVSVKEALERIKSVAKPVSETLTLPTWEAIGRVLSKDVEAPYDFPPRPRSAYDGYAVRSEDTPGKLRVVGESPLGVVNVRLRVEPGAAVYVSTGAFLPDGADTVVPEEAAKLEGDHIVVEREFKPGKNVDPVGFYCKRGQLLLREGYVVTIFDAVSLLNVAVTRVEVYRPVRVAIVATGSEIFDLGDVSPEEAERRILRGEVAETTAKLVEWALKRYTPWTDIVARILLPDHLDTVSWHIERRFTNADLIVLTGGTGPSTVDLFYQLGETLGGEVLFRGLAVRGGRPTSALALPDGRLLLALSGHPISAFHGFLRLLYPALRYLGNVKRSGEVPVVFDAELLKSVEPGRPRPIKVKLQLSDGRLYAEPLPRERQLSSVVVSNVEADGIVLVEGRGYEAGDRAPVFVYREPERREITGGEKR